MVTQAPNNEPKPINTPVSTEHTENQPTEENQPLTNQPQSNNGFVYDMNGEDEVRP